MSGSRKLLALLVSALALCFLIAVFLPDDAGSAPARRFSSSEQCRDCHPEPYAEWDGSQHSISWINPAVRALSNDFANQDCIDCHAPRPVFVTGLAERVLPRTTRRHEGVDCISCHQLPDEADGTLGGMAGTLTDPRAACRPQERIELTRPDFCAGCHNQHKTVDQWRASSWPQLGMDCLACHMPYRDGDPKRGRDHRFLGGNDLATMRSATELRGMRVDGKWRVELENVAAGHAFPTDERSRAADLFWRPHRDGAEPLPWRHLYRIRDPYRTEVDIPSTLLHAGQTLELTIEDEQAQGAVEVALFYKRSPYWEDPSAPDPEREAILAHSMVLVP